MRMRSMPGSARESPGEGDGGAVRKFLLEDRDGGQAQRLIP